MVLNAVDNIVQILLEAVYGKNSAISVDLTANQSRVVFPRVLSVWKYEHLNILKNV